MKAKGWKFLKAEYTLLCRATFLARKHKALRWLVLRSWLSARFHLRMIGTARMFGRSHFNVTYYLPEHKEQEPISSV